jgi:hypothetical protein
VTSVTGPVDHFEQISFFTKESFAGFPPPTFVATITVIAAHVSRWLCTDLYGYLTSDWIHVFYNTIVAAFMNEITTATE